ncbi:MFS transporter, partial [uncultured Pseudacidovorax sp.]|uniref:MFS transporter n=1 Tax=uncultured Pseudacidovorax sp. TaxID=679313 RepID=UPI0025D5D2C4
VGGVLIDRVARRHVPLIFVVGGIGVALAVWLAIAVQDRYAAAFTLIAANFFWGLMSPAIPSTVQHFARPEHVASAYGVVNGTGSLVAGFMPAVMGSVIAAVPAGSAAGFFAGFGMLIGTQVVVCACGLLLWWLERGNR